MNTVNNEKTDLTGSKQRQLKSILTYLGPFIGLFLIIALFSGLEPDKCGVLDTKREILLNSHVERQIQLLINH